MNLRKICKMDEAEAMAFYLEWKYNKMEKTLSDKRIEAIHGWGYIEEDVKEFIRLLKEAYKEKHWICDDEGDYDFIDNLAGKELI